MKIFKVMLALTLVSGVVFAGGNQDKPAVPKPPLSADDQKRVDSYLVSVDWLKAHQDEVIILDSRTKDEYDKGHIPGAINRHWTELSNVSVKQSETGWGLLLPQDELAEIFGALGIDGVKPVILYNDPLVGWGEEGRNLWSLRVFGIDNSFILNGGLKAWKASGGEVSREAVALKPVTLKAPARNESIVADTGYVAAGLGTCTILDVREKDEYDGKKNYGESDTGRIPGAVHFFYQDFYSEDGTIKTPAELRAIFTRLGLSPDKETVAYCTGGIRSGFATIVLKLAGFSDAKNYDGSFSAWTAAKQRVEK